METLDNEKYKYKREKILDTYKKLMFVRHPFDRFISVFKDKIEKEEMESPYNLHKKVGRQIIMKYR